MRTLGLIAVTCCILVVAGCSGSTPTAPTAAVPTVTADQAVATPAALSADEGVQKFPISGTMNIFGITPPSRQVITPSGMCQSFHFFEHVTSYGDLEGTITYDVNAHTVCDFSHLRSNGPFTAELTYKGHTGTVTGQFETNCKYDAALGGPSCDGTMTMRGAGGLEGYQFHYKWGTGWWPFSYSGTAFVQ